MPILGVVASSYAKVKSWISQWTASTNMSLVDVSQIQNGRIVSVGNVVDGSTTKPVLQVVDADGNFVAQKISTPPAGGAAYTFVNSDSSNNLYISGSYNPSGDSDVMFSKIDSSFSRTFTKRLSGSVNDSVNGQYFDSTNGYTYLSGQTSSPSGGSKWSMFLCKYNTSGTLQWQRWVEETVYGDYTWAAGSVVNSSQDVFTSGFYRYYNGSTYIWNTFLTKYDSSGAFLAQYKYTPSDVGTTVTRDLCIDAAGNLYATAYSGNGYALLTKTNSSGVIQWSRKINSTGYVTTAEYQSLYLDAAKSMLYMVGNSTSSTTRRAMIAKYDTSGNLQWVREFYKASADTYVSSIIIDSTGAIAVCGNTGVSSFVAHLPADGTKTGSYTVGGNTYTYAVGTYTDASATWTNGAGSLSSNTNPFTESSITVTDANSSYTTSTVLI